MSEKAIQIRCQAAATASLDSLHYFQGDLKKLPEEHFRALRAEILEQGFSFAPDVWIDPSDAKIYLLDGHQRVTTLRRLVSEEGYTCPDLPISLVLADTREQAKRKLLGAASQYGVVQADGLADFLKENKIDFKSVKMNLSFPEINFEKFEAKFIDISGPTDHQAEQGQSLSEKQDAYLASPTRQIVLIVDQKQYEDLMRRLFEVQQAETLDSNTDVVLHLLKAYEDARTTQG